MFYVINISPSLHHSIAWMLGFGLPVGGEWIVLLILGLLIFGRRLPEVGRSLGKTIVEFKKGIKSVEDEIEEESSKPAAVNQGSHVRSIANGNPQVSDDRSVRRELPHTSPGQATDESNPYATVQERPKKTQD
jgi:sec-independent protein translocase protein TatA